MSVVDTTNGTAAKHHIVLRKGSSLVREDICNLAKVLIDVKSTTLEGRVCGLMVHTDVPVNEVDLSKLNNLHGNVQ